jgi:hypothetical protein
VAQLRENFEVEKEKLLAEERQKWSEKLEADLKQYKVKTDAEKQVRTTRTRVVCVVACPSCSIPLIRL